MSRLLAPAAACLLLDVAAHAQIADLAAKFGAREAFDGVALSPDGTRISYINPIRGKGSALAVVDLATGRSRPILTVSDTDYQLRGCDWVKMDRLACRVRVELERSNFTVGAFTTIAVDPDGGNRREIGENAGWGRAYGGSIVSNLPDDPDNLLMMTRGWQGLWVVRVNARNGQTRPTADVEKTAGFYIADSAGRVRLKGTYNAVETASYGYYIDRRYRYAYRPKNDSRWRTLGIADLGANITLDIDGFDESGDWIYAFRPHNGRRSLFRISADDSAKSELVFAHPDVDLATVKRIGKYKRPVGVTYSTDYEHVEYFDPDLKELAARLRKALPGNSTITFIDETWDGAAFLVFAGSDTDPGAYYIYRKSSRKLEKLSSVRPDLDGLTLAAMKPVTYSAADGSKIPAYLTLPPGKSPKNLPTILMPHGGPAARDTWGFDWIAQYFAQLGYAVLQPNFRGSAGYGEDWYEGNGFKSWRTAIGDVNDGARWLTAQGIADPTRLAIFGWSYGGYAALQASATEPGLYRATVAVAPVTDLVALKAEARKYNDRLTQDYIGSGPEVELGSPARNAKAMRAPVLMFHGTRDVHVDIDQSRLMAKALKAAGKPHELVVYEGLQHSLVDNEARTDLLKRSAEFFAMHLK